MSPLSQVILGIALFGAAAIVWIWNWDRGPVRVSERRRSVFSVTWYSRPTNLLGRLPARAVSVLLVAGGVLVILGAESPGIGGFLSGARAWYHVFWWWRMVVEVFAAGGVLAILLGMGAYFSVKQRTAIPFILILFLCLFGTVPLLMWLGYLGLGPLDGLYN
jgi:hypothetical protein